MNLKYGQYNAQIIITINYMLAKIIRGGRYQKNINDKHLKVTV